MQDEMTSGRTPTDIGLNFDNEKFTDIMDKLVRRRAIDKEYLKSYLYDLFCRSTIDYKPGLVNTLVGRKLVSIIIKKVF